jgi:hypothetical protein
MALVRLLHQVFRRSGKYQVPAVFRSSFGT